MDKFGIFNILSSLFGTPLTGKSENSEGLPPAETFTKDRQSEQAKQRAELKPLQNSMLSTIKSHDDFVKRVRAKNGINQIK